MHCGNWFPLHSQFAGPWPFIISAKWDSVPPSATKRSPPPRHWRTGSRSRGWQYPRSMVWPWRSERAWWVSAATGRDRPKPASGVCMVILPDLQRAEQQVKRHHLGQRGGVAHSRFVTGERDTLPVAPSTIRAASLSGSAGVRGRRPPEGRVLSRGVDGPMAAGRREPLPPAVPGPASASPAASARNQGLAAEARQSQVSQSVLFQEAYGSPSQLIRHSPQQPKYQIAASGRKAKNNKSHRIFRRLGRHSPWLGLVAMEFILLRRNKDTRRLRYPIGMI